MKKIHILLTSILIVFAFVSLIGCKEEIPSVQTRTITVKGTAEVIAVKDNPAQKDAKLISGTFSVNDKTDLTLTEEGKAKIESAEVGALVDNVEFSITVVDASKVKMVATEKTGYIFDEWEIKDGVPEDIEDSIDAFFDANPELEISKTLEIDPKLAEWLEPEFNRGYVVTAANVETMNQTIKELNTEEITLIFKPEVLNKTNLKKALAGLDTLYELTLIGDRNTPVELKEILLSFIPASVKEVKIKDFCIPYSDTLSLYVPKMIFKNCIINTNMQIFDPDNKLEESDIEFIGCSTFSNLSGHVKNIKLTLKKMESMRRIAFYQPVEHVDCKIELKEWKGDEWGRYFFLYNPEVIKSADIEFKKYAPPFISHEGKKVVDFSVFPETIRYRFTEGAVYEYKGEVTEP